MKKPLLVLLFLFGLILGVPNSVLAAPIVPGSFSTTWDTSLEGGECTTGQICFSLGTGGDGETCSGEIYWEEIGNASNNGTSTLDSNCNSEVLVFPDDGQYRVDISGTFPTFRMTGIAERLLTVEQWGDNAWEDVEEMFKNASNLTSVGSDAPDLSQVTSIGGMFQDATSFNSNINHWDTSTIQNLGQGGDGQAGGIFSGATSFNQPLDSWDVSNVIYMESVFRGATSFNQLLDAWDVSQVESFARMFDGATSFNQPLDNWSMRESCIQVVEGEQNRFFVWDWLLPYVYAGPDTCISMRYMFNGATAFNQSLTNWTVSGVDQMHNMFNNSGLSAENYSATLVGWAAQPVLNVVTFGATGISYYDSAVAARANLVDTYGWNISDGGLYVEPGSQTFITRWDTSLDPETPNELSLYLSESATAFTIDWGDGTTQYFSVGSDDYVTHTYSTPGIKTVTITGNFPIFYAGCGDGDAGNKLIDVAQWGTGLWESFVYSFAGCTHLGGFSATDVPNLSIVTNMSNTFSSATTFNDDLSSWDVSNVTTMSYMFYDASAFNGDISTWDVSSVTDMEGMFAQAASFNGDISTWDVSNVTITEPIFRGTALSTSNYTKLLLNWSLLTLQNGGGFGLVGGTFDADLNDYINLTTYCSLAQAARDIITGTYSWSLTDGGSIACQTATYTAGEGGGYHWCYYAIYC